MSVVFPPRALAAATRGHGVDVNPLKIDLVTSGRASVVEERIGELTADVVRTGALRATTDVGAAISGSELSLVCVGTPSAPNGSLSTVYLERVTEQIGRALAEQSHRHTVVFRSTSGGSAGSA
jgi:GDP-mannose 6-dehydrogenase